MGALFKVYKSDGITEITNIKSVVFREAVNTGEHLTPGCVSSAGIEVEVFNTQANAVSAGDVVYAYVYDNANNGTLLGKFNCEPRIDTKNSYKFTAYDNALKLEADFSQWLQANQANFPMTVYALVSAACTVAGVTLASSSWPLSTQSVQAFYADGLTCRDILSYAAELAGRFVRCHTDGNIYFDWYASSANSIAPSAGTGAYASKQDGLTYANYTTTALARVAVHPSGEDDVAYIYPTGVSTGNTLHIKNNLLLTGADASFFNAAAQQVYTAVTAVGSYCPMSVNLFPRENPFRAGDIVSITDAQSVTISAPITEMTISNAAVTLVSDGRENYEDTTETAKAITQLASDVVRINKLKVDWADINTAIINYLTANDVTAQNLTIVDANDVVLATFNANGVTIGQTGQSRMEIDQNSFDLYDQDGNLYTSLGDLRDANGFATLTETKHISSASTVITVEFPIYSVSSITVDGVATTAYTPKTPTDQSITFSNTIAANSTVVVEYLTESPVYHFDLGKRKSGEAIGAWSTVNGFKQTASATFSTVSGGVNNSANGVHGTISGGGANEAGAGGSVGGGDYNRAVGNYSTVAGGYDNDATGSLSAVAGGQKNVASGVSSFAANEYNEAKGAYSVALGRANKASGNSQTAIGKFCVEDTQNTYAEIVGNGTADNARSNARTLDWSGNEWIAGALSVGDADTTRANLGDVYGAQINVTSGSADLDTYKTAGLYYFKYGVTISNAPNNASNGWLTVYADDTGTIFKQVWQRLGSNPSTFKDFYMRLYLGGSWGNWARILEDSYLPLSIANGGTGATTATGACANIGAFDLGVTANAIASGDNLNDYKTVGTYICATNVIANNLNQYGNCPTTRAFKMIVMYSLSNTYLLQIIYDYRGEAMWQRWYNSSWSSWHKYSADVASSSIVNTTYGGVTQTGGCVVRKRGNVVQCEISHGNGTTFSGLTGIDSIFTIPSGYKPIASVFLPIVARDNGTWASANYVTASLIVTSAGAAEIRYNKNVMGTMKYIVGAVTWLTDE